MATPVAATFHPLLGIPIRPVCPVDYERLALTVARRPSDWPRLGFRGPVTAPEVGRVLLRSALCALVGDGDDAHLVAMYEPSMQARTVWCDVVPLADSCPTEVLTASLERLRTYVGDHWSMRHVYLDSTSIGRWAAQDLPSWHRVVTQTDHYLTTGGPVDRIIFSAAMTEDAE